MIRLDRLTGIRGFAALYVILFHCQEWIDGFDLRPWTGLIEKGYLAVDFFFILSGFILAYVYAAEFDAGRGDYRRFLSFRLARIYPVHLVTLILSVAAVVSFFGFADAGGMANSPHTLLTNVLLIQSWGLHEQMSWNFPSWSISTEWFAYLLFPLAVSVSRMAARRPGAAIVSAIACLIILGAFTRLVTPPGVMVGSHLVASHAQRTRPFDLTIDFGLIRMSCEFLAGLLLFRAYESLADRERVWAGPTAVAAIVLLVAALHISWTPRQVLQDTAVVLLMATVILCVALDRGALTRLLEHRVSRYLGEASYSIYMLHGVVLWLYYGLVESGTMVATRTLVGGTLAAGGLMTTAVLTGALLYERIETPARRQARRIADRVLHADTIRRCPN